MRSAGHWVDRMIQLTRLNKQPLWLNSDLIKYVESSPDTLLTLLGGDKIVVRESCEEVVRQVVEFRRRVLQGLVPPGSAPSGGDVPTSALREQ